MKYLIFVFLTSCAISYYYKGKDIDNAHKKSNKQVDKALKNFDQIKQVEDALAYLKKSKFDPKATEEISHQVKECKDYRPKIDQARKSRNTKYKRLKISRKKKYQEKDKKYQKIKAFIDSNKTYSKNLEALFKAAETECGKIEKLISQYDIKILNANDLHQKFGRHKKDLRKTEKKIAKSMEKFKKQLSQSNHKNKNKINNELKELDKILVQIKAKVVVLDQQITRLKKSYGTKGALPVAKGTMAFDATQELEKNVAQYNQILKSYKKRQDNIKKLVDDK